MRGQLRRVPWWWRKGPHRASPSIPPKIIFVYVPTKTLQGIRLFNILNGIIAKDKNKSANKYWLKTVLTHHHNGIITKYSHPVIFHRQYLIRQTTLQWVQMTPQKHAIESLLETFGRCNKVCTRSMVQQSPKAKLEPLLNVSVFNDFPTEYSLKIWHPQEKL